MFTSRTEFYLTSTCRVTIICRLLSDAQELQQILPSILRSEEYSAVFPQYPFRTSALVFDLKWYWESTTFRAVMLNHSDMKVVRNFHSILLKRLPLKYDFDTKPVLDEITER